MDIGGGLIQTYGHAIHERWGTNLPEQKSLVAKIAQDKIAVNSKIAETIVQFQRLYYMHELGEGARTFVLEFWDYILLQDCATHSHIEQPMPSAKSKRWSVTKFG